MSVINALIAAAVAHHRTLLEVGSVVAGIYWILQWASCRQTRLDAEVADVFIAKNRFTYRPDRLIEHGQTIRDGVEGVFWDEMDEGLRDRTNAKRKAIADALERRRRELEGGLVHVPGERVAPFSRTREDSHALHQERRA